MFSKSRFVSFAVLAAGLLAGSSGFGAIIVPGSVLIPAAAEPDPIGATLIFSTGPVAFAIPGSLSGTLTTSVYSPDPSNPLGGLTFTYLVTNDALSSNSIGRLTVTDFTGFATDASYQPAAGVAPASIDRGISGDVIGFNFVPTPIDPLTGFLVPGGSSALLVIQTDATAYAAAIANVIDGGVTGVASVGPTTASPVPEPATLAFLGLGIVGIRIIRRRR